MRRAVAKLAWVICVIGAILTPGFPARAEEDASLPATLPQNLNELQKLIDETVSRRLEEEKKKREEKEKEDKQKKEEESKNKELQGFEVGKELGMTATWNNGLWLSTPDSSFRFHLGGRVDFDNVFFNQNQNLLFGSNDQARPRDGSDFRRLRLRADGSFWENIDYAVELNFADFQDFSNDDQNIVVGAVGLTDVWLTFRDLPGVGNLRVGHFQPPIGLEHLTITNFFNYMEFSPAFDAFLNRFNYVNGAMLFDTYLNERAALALSLMRTSNQNISPFGAGAGAGQYGLACRGTVLPLASEDNRALLHLGLSFVSLALGDQGTSPGDRALLRGGASRAELPNVMQTGQFFGPRGEYFLSPELALINGPFSLSAEHLLVYLPQTFDTRSAAGVYTGPHGPVLYHGGYVEAGLFVTPGDGRRYNRAFGVFDRTIPVQNGYLVRGEDGQPIFGRGALELTCRYSYLNLAAGNPVLTPGAGAGAQAGIEQDITLGANWYLNPETIVMLNYIRTKINSVSPGNSGAFDGFGVRVHFDF